MFLLDWFLFIRINDVSSVQALGLDRFYSPCMCVLPLAISLGKKPRNYIVVQMTCDSNYSWSLMKPETVRFVRVQLSFNTSLSSSRSLWKLCRRLFVDTIFKWSQGSRFLLRGIFLFPHCHNVPANLSVKSKSSDQTCSKSSSDMICT